MSQSSQMEHYVGFRIEFKNTYLDVKKISEDHQHVYLHGDNDLSLSFAKPLLKPILAEIRKVNRLQSTEISQYLPNTALDTVQAALLDSMAMVKKDKNYTAQADSINKTAKNIIDLNKLRLQAHIASQKLTK